MHKSKLVALICGILCMSMLICGICIMSFSKVFSMAGGITVICLSLAVGIMLPNPLSIFGLIAGIGMLIIPSNVIGILFICIGIATAIANAAVWLITKKRVKA